MTTDTLSPPQYARRLGVKSDKVRHWIATGELQAIDTSTRRGGRPQWRITTEAIRRFEAARSAVAAPNVRTQRRRRRDPGIIEFF